MTRIYFHSKYGRAEVSGAERAHFGGICSDMTFAVLRPWADGYSDRQSTLRELFPPNHYIREISNFAEGLRTVCATSETSLFVRGKQVDLFGVVLNTAYFMGSDPVRLGVRLHGQCELHAWVDNRNRQWLANIIKLGRSFRFFRDNMGWENVIKLLESEDDSPVVASYSVTEQFPNPTVAEFDHTIVNDEEDWSAWDHVPAHEQWDMAMKGLRSSGGGLELTPDNWNTFYFDEGFDANQLLSDLTI